MPTRPVDGKAHQRRSRCRVESRSNRRLSAIRSLVRRGLSRIEAAIYIGVGVTKFDVLVASGVMPKPKRIDGRRIWDIFELDLAFERLPDENSPADDTWNDIDGA